MSQTPLLVKKGKEGKFNQVVGKVTSCFQFTESEKILSFAQLQTLRLPLGSRAILENLKKGHMFSHLAVSLAVILNIKGADYLVLSRASPTDYWKLICGYREANEAIGIATTRELTEELLFEFVDGYAGFELTGTIHNNPYNLLKSKNVLPVTPLPYAHLFSNLMKFNDQTGVYIQPKHNALQSLKTCRIVVPPTCLNIRHAEDSYSAETDDLKTFFIEDGIRLCPVVNNKVKLNLAFKYTDGKLVSAPIDWVKYPQPFRLDANAVVTE